MLRELISAPPGVNLDDLAARARYVGSVEHKRYPSFAGQPRPRSDATMCPSSFKDPAPLTEWLAEGIRAGRIGAPMGDRVPPVCLAPRSRRMV